jgi:hypothetical protein
MKKLLLSLVLGLVAMSSYSQCDFSGIKLEKMAQQGNEFYFRTNIDPDTCWGYIWSAYDYQLKRVDTLEDWNGRTGVAFYVKGYYQIRLNVFNRCLGCDTTLTYDVDITVFGKVELSKSVNKKNCKLYEFEMTYFDDTCVEYYHVVWPPDAYIKKLTDEQWEKVTYVELYRNYSWIEPEVYNTESQRKFSHEFKDSGRYLVTTTYLNKCTGIDTFTIEKMNICVELRTSSVKRPVVDLSNVTVVGYYDLVGRKVDYMEPNKVYVVWYSDGRRLKVMKTE